MVGGGVGAATGGVCCFEEIVVCLVDDEGVGGGVGVGVSVRLAGTALAYPLA